MKAVPGSLPDDDEAYAYEFKWDGFRALSFWDGRTLSVKSRNDLDLLGRFPELGDLGEHVPPATILDGEICALDNRGRPSFSAMQCRGTASARPPIVYFIFDAPYLAGKPLLDLPYQQRRERLLDLGLAGAAWQTPPHRIGGGKRMLAVAKRQGLEGLIAKRRDSRYRPGDRSSDWIKIKLIKREEFVVCGYLPGAGANMGSMGSLILGFYARPLPRAPLELTHAGNVGTGFTNEQRRAFKELLDGMAIPRSHFRKAAIPRVAVYAEPALIVEVEFSEWTHEGIVRHPRFVALREDKPPREVLDPRPASPVPR